MKILCIGLNAFGSFTDEQIDLESKKANMHIIYGLNEAGKSTALRAVRSLFYGIPRETTDNYLHDNKSLRISGKLAHSDGTELEFLRRKGNKNTVLDPDANPMDDNVLSKFLGSVTSEEFVQVFGISHDDLVKGGNLILEGKGAVGESLLAAGTGGISLRQLLQEIEEEMDDLYKQKGQLQRINKAIKAYEDALTEVSNYALSASEWEKHFKALDRAEKRKTELAKEILSLSAEKNRLERLQQALPLIARRADILTKLYELGEVVVLTEEFSESRQKAMNEMNSSLLIQDNGNTAMARLKDNITKLDIPEAILEQEANIKALYSRLGGINKAAKDLPKLEQSRNDLQSEARAILLGIRPELTIDDADSLRTGLAQKSEIRSLAGQYRTISTSIDSIGQALQRENEELVRLREEASQLEAPRDASSLRRALHSLSKKGNLLDARAQLVSQIEDLISQTEIELSRLPLWQGTSEELERAAIPALETVDRFEGAIQNLESELQRRTERHEQVLKDLHELEEELSRLDEEGPIPSEEDLVAARERRDSGWKLIRRSWLDHEDVSAEESQYDPDNSLPEAYERNVAVTDELSDQLRREAERVAKKSQLSSQYESNENEEKELAGIISDLRAQLDIALDDWKEAWSEAGIEPLSPREMRAWLGHYSGIVQGAKNIRDARLQLQRLDKEIVNQKTRLVKLLNDLGEDASAEENLDSLAEWGDRLVSSIESTENTRSQLARDIYNAQQRLDQQQKAGKDADNKLEQWRQSWGDCVSGLGFSSDNDPDDVLDFIDDLEKLFRKLDEATSYTGRIEGIQTDEKRFSNDVNELSKRIAPGLKGKPAVQIAAELHALLETANKKSAKREQMEAEIEIHKSAVEDAEITIKSAKGILDSLCKKASCKEPDELEEAERRSDTFKRLSEGIETLESQLLELRKGGTLEDLLSEAESVDADELPAHIKELESQLSILEGARSDIDQIIGAERSELGRMDGSDTAAEKREEAEDKLASIRPDAERYIQLSIARRIITEEIERYRQENQGPLLGRAGEIFSKLTGGSFSGLEIGYDEGDNPVILGIRDTGNTIGVEAMSDGTCDQLYLALRLAYIERYREDSEPMPLIVDDILIRFDDDRARAALEVLLDISEETQVIFFTHHSRLVDLAKKLAQDGRIEVHRLAS